MSRFPKPCLTCNQLTTGASYCDKHLAPILEAKRIKENLRKRGRTLYNSTAYRKQRAWIKATATHCHICKQAFIDRNQISADHLIPGDPNSPLAPAHIICNSRRGNKPLSPN